MTFVLFPATTADTDSEFHIYDTETGTRYLIEDLNKTSNAYGLGPTVAALSGDRFVFAAYDGSEPQVYVVDALFRCQDAGSQTGYGGDPKNSLSAL